MSDDLVMLQLFEKRADLIGKGLIGRTPGTHQQAAQRILNKPEHKITIRREIAAWGLANQSDPFAKSRAFLHYNNGIAELGDYGRNHRP